MPTITLPRLAPHASPELLSFAKKIDEIFMHLEIAGIAGPTGSTGSQGGTGAQGDVGPEGPVGKAIFIQVFDDPIESVWTLRTGDNTGVTYPTNGTTGGKVFATSKRVRLEFPENIAYDPRRIYRLRARARITSFGGAILKEDGGFLLKEDGSRFLKEVSDSDFFRWGLVGFAANGTTIVDHLGGTNPLLSHTVGADFQFISLNTFEYFEAYVTLNGSPGSNVPGTPALTSRMHSNVKYVRPFLETNYKGGVGSIEVDFIAIDIITVDAEIDALLTRNAPADAGAQVFSGQDFALLTSRFFANLLRSATNNSKLSVIVSQVDDVGDLVSTILLDDGASKRIIAKGKQEGSNVDQDVIPFDPTFQNPPTVFFAPVHLTSKNSFLAPFQHDFISTQLDGQGNTEIKDEGNGVGKPKTDLQSPMIVAGYDFFGDHTGGAGTFDFDVFLEIDVGATGAWDILAVQNYFIDDVSDPDINITGVSFVVVVPGVTIADKFRLRIKQIGISNFNLDLIPRGLHYFVKGETLVKILADDLTVSGFNLIAKIVQRNTIVTEITDVFPAGTISTVGGIKALGSLSAGADDDEYRTFFDVIMDINSADTFVDKVAVLTGLLTGAGQSSGEPTVTTAQANQYTVKYTGGIDVTASTSGSPVTDVFPAGIIDAVGESKVVTLSKDPIADVIVAWSRTVDATCGDCADLGDATAGLTVKIEKDTGSGFVEVVSRIYGTVFAVAAGPGESNNDNGADSIAIAGLKAGDKVKISITVRTCNASGACCTCIAQADPTDLQYDESAGHGTNTVTTKIQAFESSVWVTKDTKVFVVTDTDGVKNTLSINESIVITSSTATKLRVLLDTVVTSGSVALSNQTIDPDEATWKEGAAETATLTLVVAVDSKDGANAHIERGTLTFVLTDTTGNGAPQLNRTGQMILFVDSNINLGDDVRVRVVSAVVTGNADSSSFSVDPVNVKLNTFGTTPTEVSATPLSSDRIHWVALAG